MHSGPPDLAFQTTKGLAKPARNSHSEARRHLAMRLLILIIPVLFCACGGHADSPDEDSSAGSASAGSAGTGNDADGPEACRQAGGECRLGPAVATGDC